VGAADGRLVVGIAEAVDVDTSSTACGTAGSTRGRVFDLELPLDRAAEGYRAMDERRAIKVLLEP
jgi:hypothetical protein